MFSRRWCCGPFLFPPPIFIRAPCSFSNILPVSSLFSSYMPLSARFCVFSRPPPVSGPPHRPYSTVIVAGSRSPLTGASSGVLTGPWHPCATGAGTGPGCRGCYARDRNGGHCNQKVRNGQWCLQSHKWPVIGHRTDIPVSSRPGSVRYLYS